MKRTGKTALWTVVCLVMLTMTADAQDSRKPIEVKIEGAIVKPAQREATDERVAGLTLPAGFTVTKFAEGLGKPRMIAAAADGTVYVTRRDTGDVVMLRDTDGNGRADVQKTVLRRDNVHGIALHGNRLYIVTVKEVLSAALGRDGTPGALTTLADNLPDGGQHPNRTLAFGPDGLLYVTVGSQCNACRETNKESATILQMRSDGSKRRIYARGLRNTIGFDWHPQTKELYGMDHGIDWLGDDEQQEELNKLVDGGDYGWPYIYGDGKYNPADQPENMTYEEYAAKSRTPELMYQAHSSPLGMVFYTGSQFPERYRNGAFITFHGSWNRTEPVGYKVVFLRFENGRPTAFEDFMTGFLIEGGKAQFGRVTGITQHPDGSLLITDDSGGVVYRVSYNDRKN